MYLAKGCIAKGMMYEVEVYVKGSRSVEETS